VEGCSSFFKDGFLYEDMQQIFFYLREAKNDRNRQFHHTFACNILMKFLKDFFPVPYPAFLPMSPGVDFIKVGRRA
jgi:hypothetical protein